MAGEIEPAGTGDDREDLPLKRRHPALWWVLMRFQLNIDALREMLATMGPNMRQLDESRLGANALAALKSLGEEDKARLEAAFGSMRIRAESDPSADTDMTTRLVLDEASEKLFEEIFHGDRHALGSFVRGIQNAFSGPSRTSIVFNSLLVMAVSAFEVLVAGVMARFFIAHPQAMSTDRKEFSLDDIYLFESSEDAADQLLAQRVDSAMEGGLDAWSVWFQNHCKADLAELAIDWQATREIFQRRHVVTHTGGLVSSAYLAKVSFPSGTKRPTRGERLTVDEAYLENAFDQLDALGSALAALAWGTWHPDQRDVSAQQLVTRSYQAMMLNRWRVSQKLAGLHELIQCAEDTRHALRCNCWLSEAERAGYPSIAESVRKWDASAIAGRFKLARLVLLQDLEQASKLVPTLLSTEEITPGEVREWPILRTLREHPSFAHILADLDRL
jgi:hypothetical protein